MSPKRRRFQALLDILVFDGKIMHSRSGGVSSRQTFLLPNRTREANYRKGKLNYRGSILLPTLHERDSVLKAGLWT